MNPIVTDFFETQRRDGLQLASESDLLELEALDLQRYIATFRCRGLVLDIDGAVREHDRHVVGIRFPESYLLEVNPAELFTWLDPMEAFHPNVQPPYVCTGAVVPGTPLVDLLYRLYELVTLDNVTMHEGDALNQAACAWARRHRERFPIDRRPIKRPSPSQATGDAEASR